MASATTPAFYESEPSGALQPTALAAGPPWLPGTQHGSMVAALIARAAEAVPAAVPMQLARLSVDLTRAVPTGRTRLRTSVAREGRRVQVVDVELLVAGEVRARGSVLRIRVEPGLASASAPWPDHEAGSGPDSPTIASPLGPDPLWDAHDARWQHAAPGEGSVWLRPHRQLVEGEPLSPTLRAALVADLIMSNGGAVADRTVVNPDLTLFLHRPPVGPWINVRSRVRIGPDGIGQSEGSLHDEQGWVGRVCKTLLVMPRA
jgi:hypothetical protein